LNWANDTYDAIVETMMTASEYSTVLDAAHAAQEVFVHNVPMIVWYTNWVIHAYRTDRFEGWVKSPGRGMIHPWVTRKIKLKPNQPDYDSNTECGGTYRSTISYSMDSQNPLMTGTVAGFLILLNVYSSLTGLDDPRDLQPIRDNGGLAYDWTSQPHDYGMKYTFFLFDNASWHDLGGNYDGRVTAYDVAFTYNYIRDHNIPQFSTAISFLNSCQALDDFTVEIITNGASYFTFDQLRSWPILPEHIWSGIVSPITFTNPHPVGSGPFQWYRRIEGEYIEIHFWEHYHKGIPGHAPQEGEQASYLTLYILVGVVVIALVLLGSLWYLRKK
jgi:peptide/nickel transport system substrate-binding protein